MNHQVPWMQLCKVKLKNLTTWRVFFGRKELEELLIQLRFVTKSLANPEILIIHTSGWIESLKSFYHWNFWKDWVPPAALSGSRLWKMFEASKSSWNLKTYASRLTLSALTHLLTPPVHQSHCGHSKWQISCNLLGFDSISWTRALLLLLLLLLLQQQQQPPQPQKNKKNIAKLCTSSLSTTSPVKKKHPIHLS